MITVRYAITSGDFDPTIRIDHHPTGHAINLDEHGRLDVTAEDGTWLATYHANHWITAQRADNPEPATPGQQPHHLPGIPGAQFGEGRITY